MAPLYQKADKMITIMYKFPPLFNFTTGQQIGSCIWAWRGKIERKSAKNVEKSASCP
jgi:hypothetical protein